MRIYYSTDSDPMILSSISNLNTIHSELETFLKEDAHEIRIEADVTGSPEPYTELLPYIRFVKSHKKVNVKFTDDRGLLVSGSVHNLSQYIEAFKFKDNEDGCHHHPELHLINEEQFEMDGVWPFIEADNECE